ncbi:hypothetical protein FEP84_04828 [Burkholderia multivorans]|nr:hypothetical protein [Burkholderia multivorans]
MPPACANAARSSSMNDAKPFARSAAGVQVVTPHAWPAALNASGGAPSDSPRSSVVPCAHASLPARSEPTARSAISPIAMPARRAACCASVSACAAHHCRNAWNATVSACACANASTSTEVGIRHGAGHCRQSEPSPRATQNACSASKRACASSAAPPAARNRSNPSSAVPPPARSASNRARSRRSFCGSTRGQSTSRASAAPSASSPATRPTPGTAWQSRYATLCQRRDDGEYGLSCAGSAG